MPVDIIKIPSKGKCSKPQEVNITYDIVDTESVEPSETDDIFDI